jgi:predicted nucleotidyltransferase
MLTLQTIREMSDRMVQAAAPERIVLFGSYATGHASEESDVDFLVIANDRRPRPRRSTALYGLLRDYHIGKDILVYTPEEVEEYRGLRGSLVNQALSEGIVLYEKQV